MGRQKMDISIFIAKTLGLYLLIVSIGTLLNASRVKKVLNDIIDNPSLLLLSGILALIFGILLVVSHNIWQPDWRVIITLVGWLALVKGIICICYPKLSIKITRYFVKKKAANKISGIITLFLGIFLCYFGF
jgi:uncharacterized membrane protein HdeD (DUF308 family)